MLLVVQLHNKGCIGCCVLYLQEILWTTSPNPTYISQYFVLKETESSSDFEMCSIKGHQWNPGSRINIVVAVKNGAAWIKYLIDNIENVSYTSSPFLANYTCPLCRFT